MESLAIVAAITKNSVRNIDSFGNIFNPGAQLAEMTKKNYSNMVVTLRDEYCASFPDVGKRFLISALKNRAVKNFLLVTLVNAR